MAAAEARAAWQRTVNRCFVQEDAKRAPKLACPSSAYPSSKQLDAGPTSAADGLEIPCVGFMPLNRSSSYSNLLHESRRWLQIQPNYVYQKGLTHEQVSAVGAEMENCEATVLNVAKTEGDVPFVGVEKHPEMGESYELLEMDSIGSSTSKKVDDLDFGSGSPWAGSGRSDPWWRVADRDELASLVSQRSFDLVENCDLPRPENRSMKWDPRDYSMIYDHAVKAQKSDFSSPKVDMDGIFALRSATVLFEERGQFGSHKQSSLTEPLESDLTKVQLMEALCHSQTRAREAEKAVKQANAEKEHILKLFFKQASHLFAYKQWFQLLQLENIYFHISNSNQPLSSLFPVDLPFAQNKSKKLPKNRPNPAKAKKRGKRARGPEQDFGKFAVAFALGLGLVGAGLFLGWTVAWMFPGL